jgi:short-subunit dehydrogenase
MHKEYYTVITGASEGFGKALSLECARRGMNLILVALPGDELDQLARFIQQDYAVKTICIAHDLTKKEECYKLLEKINDAGLAVNMLINNAGMGGSHYYHRQIELNVVAPTLLTHLFLDNLKQHSPSYILNVGSLAGFFNLPLKQVYGGTKSYIASFSKSLREELRHKNVFVSAVCPGGMNTTLALILQNRSLSGISRWSVMNPEQVATVAIDEMLRKKAVIIPGFWNRFFVLLDKLLPDILKECIISRKMKQQEVFNLPSTSPINRSIRHQLQ